ncbi:MAG TPA: MBL fold metallo-hydrolase [Kineosporiaceae bacterium]|nr:MBL fold metallo-hydrolase [Kineosporiaceae bacterium]
MTSAGVARGAGGTPAGGPGGAGSAVGRLTLSIVGCSGSFPSPDSAASCYLLQAPAGAGGAVSRVLLDLGSGALGPLQRLTDVHDLDAVLLSHLHPDHFMDLCGLYVALKYDPDRSLGRRLLVYGPGGTADRLRQAYGSDVGRLEEVFDVREWRDHEPVVVGGLAVTPIRVNHPVEAYGLRAEAGGAVVTYTGDTDTCPALHELARDADLLLAEASFQEGRDTVRDVHLTGQRAGQVATEAGARRLLLTHLPPWNDPGAVLAEARSSYPGPLDVVSAGQSYPL